MLEDYCKLLGRYLCKFEPGVYYHFGFKKSIERLIDSAQPEIKNLSTIEVWLNIDGLPLSKSSRSQLYPILCNLFKQKYTVHVVGLYHGNEKPKHANESFGSVLTEAIDIVKEGLTLNEKKNIM